ncbi:hypothetical protein AAFF_G00054530 [Aldrovandia affinis]|uniref:Major facilitator superfamily (MFS) profile domain-containing protein n=1 Tax=Aldrovandia affinis TaxID=143900 RepID=A0AAD7S116_9TELE|nr:hypothetical protein AAFF_G00054530 [Aldrovandia affinis]
MLNTQASLQVGLGHDSSVVRFHTGERGGSDSGEHEVQIEGMRATLELGHSIAPPCELTNPAEAGTLLVEDVVELIGFGKFQWKLSILSGLFWMADAMEMMILSVLTPQLHCEWRLPAWKVAMITSVVFLGIIISSSIWGNICDKYGRKTGLTLSVLWTMLYGFLSAVAPGYGWFLFLRSLVGFGIGGAPQSVTLYAEFLPMKSRGICIMLSELFWALGTVFEVLLAFLVMPTLGWRWLLGFSTLPLVIFALLCFWLPESARYDVLTGHPEKAMTTLRRIATENKAAMPIGTLSCANQEHRGRIQDLFCSGYWKTTGLLWFIWFSFAFSYFGLVLLTSVLLQSGDECGVSRGYMTDGGCSLQCNVLTSSDYKDLLWTTLSEFPGLLVTVIAIDRIGRRKTMALCFLVFALCILPLYACIGRTARTAFIFIARAVISGGFQAVYVYTPEVYPTASRALGMGICNGMGRVGALLTPFVAQMLLRYSLVFSLSVYFCCSLLAAVLCCVLPIETSGRGLQETSQPSAPPQCGSQD